MRDILGDLDSGPQPSDPDPVRRTQSQMRTPLPKRFYDSASVFAEPDGGFSIRLDGKPVRTPGRALLALPNEAAARLVADEFDAQREVVDPVSMPVLRLANSAIDGVAGETQAVIEDIMRYSSSDLVCYRADGPQPLVDRQAKLWDPVLDWAKAELGARFWLAEGVMHVEQPQEAVTAVGEWLARRDDPFTLAALHVMTSLTGSALLALSVEAGAIDADAAWVAAHVDEDWNIEQWGEDEEAAARRTARKADYDAANRLIAALRG